MIVASLYQSFTRQTAVADQFLGVRERDRFITAAMQDQSSCLHDTGGSVFLPRRAQQHQTRITSFQIHRNSATSARPNDDIRRMGIELPLRHPKCQFEVVIRKFWVQDNVTTVFQECRLDATRHRLPAMKKENPHCGERLVEDLAFPVVLLGTGSDTRKRDDSEFMT